MSSDILVAGLVFDGMRYDVIWFDGEKGREDY